MADPGRKRSPARRAWKPWAATVLLGLAVYLPLALPYATRDRDLRAPEPHVELQRHGATLASFVTPSRHSPLQQLGFFPRIGSRGTLFLGFAASALAVVGLASRVRRGSSARRRWPARARLELAGGLALVAGRSLLLADLWTLHWPPFAAAERGSFSGYRGAAALAALGAAWTWRTLRRVRGGPLLVPWESPLQRGLMAVGICGGLLSLPMVLALAQDLVPPLEAMRVSHRSFVLALPAIGWLSGRGFEVCLGRLRPGRWRTLALALILATVALELSPRLPPWDPVPCRPADFPAYLSYLRDAPDVRGYVELPFAPGWHETERMYLQTWNWKPLVNG